MTKLVVFLFFWLAMTLSFRLGDMIMSLLLLPTFLWIYTEAEDLDSDHRPVTRQEPDLGA